MSTAASKRKAAAEKAAAVHWPLSSQEKAAIEYMDRKAAERGRRNE